MSSHTRWVLAWYLAGAASLAAVAVGLAQTGDRPLQKLFGGGTSKGGAAKAAPAEDPRRRTEIAIELAWLADPITFAYFLEARVEGSTLSVRGYVPDKTVRDHALKLARLHCTYAVADNLKEHPSLLVRPARESAAQLQSAVVATLKEALPKQLQRLQVQCAADGTVTLHGTVQSAEEKLIASHALRRLYGCTSVQNLTQLPGAAAPDQTKSLPKLKDEVATGSAPAQPPPAGLGPPVPRLPATLEGPSLQPPEELKAPPPAKKEEPAKVPPGTGTKLALSAEQLAKLQRRVLEACDGAKDVKIEVTTDNKVRIELTVRSDDQISPLADKVYNVPELMDYREALELHFTVGQEK